jgi:serine phosphatase RsbU (regulator of sigma subunit)/anti-sigma regulatory factor (Ser/Thr protein kinase)
VQPVDIAPNDPILVYLQSTAGPIDVETLTMDSPGLRAIRESGMKLVVPLVNQGELIGLLNLGPRLSEQDYSMDDRTLLENLAGQVAPAVMVAQLVQQQEAEARSRERVEQELRVAQLIQQNFLPKETPELPGWEFAAYYQPAREVGGDFYDFITLDDGRLGLVIGDVTDKGVPAALVMASTRSVIRAAAQRLSSPGQVLQRVNELICPDIPANMFVTCLYCILEPKSGALTYANAGHNLPYRHTSTGAEELRATGMPLGLLPGMSYEEGEVMVSPDESILFHSDGLAEARDAGGEMFGFPRLLQLVGLHGGEPNLIDRLRSELVAFTGREREQEDDVTLVTLSRSGETCDSHDVPSRLLDEFSIASEPGNERQAIERVASVAQRLELPDPLVERVKTAVAEGTMNALEHGNQFRPDLLVFIRVVLEEGKLRISISDSGGEQSLPEIEAPDLEAKLAGRESARGWGLFLIKDMVDEVFSSNDGSHHTVELVFQLEGARDG